jgi:hypothetical protein
MSISSQTQCKGRTASRVLVVEVRNIHPSRFSHHARALHWRLAASAAVGVVAILFRELRTPTRCVPAVRSTRIECSVPAANLLLQKVGERSRERAASNEIMGKISGRIVIRMVGHQFARRFLGRIWRTWRNRNEVNIGTSNGPWWAAICRQSRPNSDSVSNKLLD